MAHVRDEVLQDIDEALGALERSMEHSVKKRRARTKAHDFEQRLKDLETRLEQLERVVASKL